jgi:conjugative relaxase-like TrwC/TraI family protein
MGLRKLTPGGYEYLTGSVACADRRLELGESLSDYYFAHGYPPGEWFGAGAAELGVSGKATAAQLNALFGEGRHPDADDMEADLVRAGATPDEATKATRLGRRFAQYSGIDGLRCQVLAAYKQHNLDHGHPADAPLNEATRASIRTSVQTQLFRTAHNGREPENKGELTQWLSDQKHALRTAVAGYEVVFAPPKSVSVAWALGDRTSQERIANLHRQAVKDTLLYLENNAAFTRGGGQGEAQVDVVGVTAVLFEHWDSRAGDPHLHTHVPISAKVRRAQDGKWTSLDGRTLLAAAVTMSESYNSRLRDLFREEGGTWVEVPHGGIDLKRPVWELDGVPHDLLTGFSQRAQEVEIDRANRIVTFRQEHDREPTPKEVLEIGKRAQYGTRRAKQTPKSLANHRRLWREQALSMVAGEQLDSLGARVFAGPVESTAAVDTDQLAQRTRFVVSDSHSHFNRWNIEAEAHRQTAHLNVGPAQREQLILRITEAVVNAPDTVALQAPSLVNEPAQLRRRSGESVFVEHNSTRYTTEDTLREEAALVEWARRRDGHRLTAETLTAAMQGLRLNVGQQHMITEFARSGHRVQLALAPAGSGKTTAMRVLADAWRSAGGRVYAFGPSARAAHELGAAIDATPHTLHQVTTALRLGVAKETFAFRRGDLLIVDEAAMAGTHTLHTVVAYALRRGADVRLVGDDKQLGAVEAGGAIRLIAHDVGAVRFREVVRFRDPGQAAASLQIREGNKVGLDYYLGQNWVDGGSRETMRDAAQRAWRRDLDRGRQTLLIVPTNEDVVWLNLQARAQRIQRRQVHDARAVSLHDGTRASVGDWVVTRENNRLLSLFSGRDFVKNGDVWAVTVVHRNGDLDVAHLSDQATTRLPADYVSRGVELAYATTINRVQGMTSEGSAHTVVPRTMTREQLYPAITRARENNRLYVETVQHVIDDHRETPPEQTARNVLIGVLNHTEVDTSATEELRDSLSREESLATLVSRYEYALRQGSDDRLRAVLTKHYPRALGQPAEPALLQTLRNAEDLGWQAERLVPAVARGDLTKAQDPAAVLQWRIDQQIRSAQPPARTAEPSDADLARWQAAVRSQVTGADVDAPAWSVVWQRAAGAAIEGLDADSAIRQAAEALADSNRPTDSSQAGFVGYVLAGLVERQRAAGCGWHSALPWLATPTNSALRDDPAIGGYLRRTNAAIAARATELREQVADEQPAWTAGLGARPTEAKAAAAWDDLAGLAAAYRETYRISGEEPNAPIGPEPDTSDTKARAWRTITERWRPPVTTPEQQLRAENQRRIDALRDQLAHDQQAAELVEDSNEETAGHALTVPARHADRYDDPEVTDERTEFRNDLTT